MQADISIRRAALAQFNKIWHFYCFQALKQILEWIQQREAQIFSPVQQFNTFRW